MWQSQLGQSLRDEGDYAARVEGAIPAGLRGTLYRNGPGLFERDGVRKSNILDGDGMVQAFGFGDGGVRYRNRFVRTEKFVEEEAQGRFRHPTWTTLAPSWPDNLPGFPSKSQAGVTVIQRGGRLFAIDETGPPYELDPVTLETVGPAPVVVDPEPGSIKAHTKVDARSGDWIILGWTSTSSTELEVIVRGRDGKLASRVRTPAPRGGYIHDFFATENHVIVNLHAVEVNPLPMLAGLRSVTGSLRWKPELGNLIMVIDKSGVQPARTFEAPAAWMWHALNAYEQGGTIIADFVGFDSPDHFLGKQAVLSTVMRGRIGRADAAGTLRRYVIDLAGGSLRQELIADGNFEFPAVSPRDDCHAHRFGYACIGERGTVFHDGVARFDLERGETETFRFGDGFLVGEPVFAPDGTDGAGWLLSLVLEGATRRSFVAVFDAAAVSAGPLAKVHLRHHSPYSFHGWWQSANA